MRNDEPSSIHSASIDAIYNIPMKDISRPLPSTLDEKKVQSLIETIQVKSTFFFFLFRILCLILVDRIGSSSSD